MCVSTNSHVDTVGGHSANQRHKLADVLGDHGIYSLVLTFAIFKQDNVAVAGTCLPKCRICGLQVGTMGTPENLVSRTCQELTAQRQQHKVAAPSAAAPQHTFTAYDGELRSV